jgi:hypothetical protein
MTSDKHSKSLPEQQKNNTDQRLQSLTDSEIEELIRFFQLLDEWDREQKSEMTR